MRSSEGRQMSGIPPSERDLEVMGAALLEAEVAGGEGGIPVGALILGPDGNVIATGRNSRVLEKDPTAHAEVLSLIHI